MQMVVALKPLYDEAGIERLVIAPTRRSPAPAAARSRSCSTSPTRCCTSATSPPRRSTPTRSPSTRSPTPAASPPGDDHTDEERKLINETRKILGDDSIAISATCVRVPVVNGHSEAVNVQTRDPLSPERAREVLAAAPGVAVLDDPAGALYPQAIDATGRDEVFVGRIRRDPGNERALDMWVVADNLRKGAAMNAMQLAERSTRAGWSSRRAHVLLRSRPR